MEDTLQYSSNCVVWSIYKAYLKKINIFDNQSCDHTTTKQKKFTRQGATFCGLAYSMIGEFCRPTMIFEALLAV